MAYGPDDTAALLGEIEQLPLTKWSYKDNAPVPHVGPPVGAPVPRPPL